MAIEFTPDFVWGAATAAYQIEGAVRADGRGPSIWDVFSHTPGKVRGGDTGDVACDHYHRLEEDLDLMARLGLGAYRFSIAWPRVLPDGRGRANQRGLDFYRRLVDGLLERGITPFPTLYHWDLPQALEDAGGWPARDTAHRFAEYAAIVHSALGDRVTHWTTLNEPWCSAFLGYSLGEHAPGRTEPAAAMAAAHHLLLGHGEAVAALRAGGDGRERLSITLNFTPVEAASSAEADLDAARRVDGLQNRWFLDAVVGGAYPPDVLGDVSNCFDVGVVRDGDLQAIAAPLDALGVNYYTTAVIGAGSGPRRASPTPWPCSADAVAHPPQEPTTAMGWGIDPDGLARLLVWVSERCPEIPLYVTENGAAFPDRPAADGSIDDAERTEYLAGHVRAVHDALGKGADVRGYFVWSLMDNFEWAKGYAKRFGLYHIDYRTQERVPKRSAHWYASVIRANALPEGAR